MDEERIDWVTDWEALYALTRQRRAERRAQIEAARPPTIRYSPADGRKDERDTAAARAWKVRQWQQGNRRCAYCLRKLTWRRNRPHSITVDHRISWGASGLDTPMNWCLACLECNNRKGDLSEAEFRALLARD